MTMLLALIIIAAVTTVGIGAAILIATQLSTRASSDDTIKAYYAADTGMERALFTIFNGRIAGMTLSDSNPCRYYGYSTSSMPLCSQVVGNYPEMTTSLLNDATVTLRKTSQYDTTQTITIPGSQTVEYNFAWIANNASAQILPPRSIVISAPGMAISSYCSSFPEEDRSECMDTTPGIEVRWSYLLRSGQGTAVPDTAPANATVRLFSFQNVSKGVVVDLFTGTPSTDYEYGLTLKNPTGLTEIPSTLNFSSISGWIIRVTALNGTIPNFTLLACSGTGNCTDVPAEQYNRSTAISVVSQGVVHNSSITLKAKVPWYLPASGIFDYALFSEQSLIPD